jgi:hypothetical protein
VPNDRGGYCAAVRAVAADVYAEAQDMQRSWEQCVAEQGGSTSPPPPKKSCGSREHGATWPVSDCTDGSEWIVTFVCDDGVAREVDRERPAVDRCAEH